jgi:hypothetical protein
MRFRRRELLTLAVLVLSGDAACQTAKGSMQIPPAVPHEAGTGAALSGAWGGEGISLEITEDGARVEYDCAHGTVDRRIVPDRRGRFDVPGTHVEEQGGPVREAPVGGGYPVRFAGHIDGNVMKLIVRRTSDRELLGTFSLTAGQEPSLVKCR